MNLYENQRWNQVLRKGMSYQGMKRTYDNNIMDTDVISHGGH